MQGLVHDDLHLNNFLKALVTCYTSLTKIIFIHAQQGLK